MIITEILRKKFQQPLVKIGKAFLQIGLHPNHISILGLIGNAFNAVLIAIGYLPLAGIGLIVFSLLDALDGTMARLAGTSPIQGSFLDSIVDRYSEMLILVGLTFYLYKNSSELFLFIAITAFFGTMMVPYIRAKSESLSIELKNGVCTRVERCAILTLCLVVNQPEIGIALIAILTNITAIQRIIIFYKKTKKTN